MTQVKNLAVILFFTFLFAQWTNAQNGHHSDFITVQIDFDSNEDLRHFIFTDENAWRWNDAHGGSIELYQQSEYQPPVRSPLNIAVYEGEMFGSFTLDVEAKQTGREYGHRDLCFFFNIKDASNFYYVHLASEADPHAHNIFLVNDEARKAIASHTTDGVQWGNDWNTIRIKRDIQSGMIRVYFNDMDSPIMEATDVHFKSGYIGIGSFDDTGQFDNLTIQGIAIQNSDALFPKG